jgi:hypothetical protein
VTFANPIDSVLSGLNVTMVGTCTSSSTMVAQNDNAGSPGSSAATPDAAFARAMTNAKAIKDRHDDELMNIPGVVGTAIGKGSTPGQVAIHVYIQKDTPEVRKHLPNQIEGVPVIIRETGDINAL